MGITRFPHGVSSFGIPLYGSGLHPFGPGCGKVIWMVYEKSYSDLYYKRLIENGIADYDIVTTPAAGYALLTSDQNDVLAIMPGAYVVTESLTWAKDRTTIITLGGPNMRHCPSTATNGAAKITCTTADIDSILSITGHYVSIYGLETQNTYSSNASRCDVQILGKNTYLNGCHFRGGQGANQINHADGGVPLIVSSGTAGAGNGFTAENSIFGSAGNTARTVGAGSVLFEGGAAAGFAPIFRNCTFEMRCETSGSANPKLIHLAGNYAVDRYLLLDSCFFYNFYENLGGLLDYAIVDACATTHAIVLKDCAMFGIDAWCNVATYCMTTIANAASDGGKGIAVDTTP